MDLNGANDLFSLGFNGIDFFMTKGVESEVLFASMANSFDSCSLVLSGWNRYFIFV